MNRIFLTLLIALVTTTACQKAADEQSSESAAVTPAESMPAQESSASTSSGTSSESAEPEDVAYRIVRASLYRSDQTSEILVPEDVDVSSGRLIEYEEGEDGQYYFVSLIPQ